MKPVIYWIPGPWPGQLAILARPRGGEWLADEIRGWQEAGVELVVSLLSADELSELGLVDEARLVKDQGLAFISFPIADYGVPSSESALRNLVNKLRDLLVDGHCVGIHCRQGIGRSSLVTACLLVSSGQDLETSFKEITDSRGRSVPDTADQRRWVGNFARLSTGSHFSR